MAVTVGEYVGQRARDRRDELGMTQEEFGRQIGHWLGKPWSRSTVSVAENGKRAFTAAEIVAIAHVLDTSPSRLFTPPYGVSEVVMPTGAVLQARAIERTRSAESAYQDHYTEALLCIDQAMQANARVHAALKRLGTASPRSAAPKRRIRR